MLSYQFTAFLKLSTIDYLSYYISINTSYVYQPIESLFLLLITNKASNIVEDLETLRLLSKLVPEIAGGFTEEKVGCVVVECVMCCGCCWSINFPKKKNYSETNKNK